MNLLYHKQEGLLQSFSYSMKIKKQTRKLATGCSKHCFEVVDRTDEVSSKHCFEVVDKTDKVSHISTTRRSRHGLKRFSKSINYPKQIKKLPFPQNNSIIEVAFRIEVYLWL